MTRAELVQVIDAITSLQKLEEEELVEMEQTASHALARAAECRRQLEEGRRALLETLRSHEEFRFLQGLEVKALEQLVVEAQHHGRLHS